MNLKQKGLIFAIILILALTCSACKGNGVIKINQSSSSNENFTISNAETNGHISSLSAFHPENNTDYNLLITNTYSEDELFKVINPCPKTDELIGQTGYNLNLVMLNEQFTIECLRKMDDGRYYVIYKTKENGLLYVFFKQFYDELYYTHCFYWYPNINISKYQSGVGVGFKQGQANDEVLERLTKENPICPVNLITSGENEFFTLHPTKSGLTCVVYKLCNGSISNSLEETYNATFNVSVESSSDFIFEYMGQNFDCSILEIDKLER